MNTIKYIHPIALEKLNSTESKRALAFYYKLKCTFVNSVIYTPSTVHISKKTGISPYNVSRWLRVLRTEGYIYEEGDRLRLISFKDLMRKLTGIITNREGWHALNIQGSSTINDIVKQFEYVLIKQNIKRQEYIISLKRDLKKYSSPKRSGDKKEYKKLLRRAKRFGVNKSGENFDGKVIISARSVSSLIGRSLFYSNKLLSELESDGRLYARRLVSLVIKTKKCLDPYLPTTGHYYYKHGWLYQDMGREVVCWGNY